METCVFCAEIKDLSSIPAGVLYEDDLVYASHWVDDDEPSYLGCILVKTKRHTPGFTDLTAAEGQAIGLALARLSNALKVVAGAEKVYVEMYAEVTPHLHVFLIARYPGTPEKYWRWNVQKWPDAPRGDKQAVDALATRLRAHLASSIGA